MPVNDWAYGITVARVDLVTETIRELEEAAEVARATQREARKVMEKEKKIRYTVDLEPAAHQGIADLQEKVGARSKSQLFQDAVKSHKILADHLHQGYRIIFRKEGEPDKEIYISSLEQ